MTLRGPQRLAPYRRALLEAQREVAGLVQLSNDLLLLARADEDRLPLRSESVEPGVILESLKRRFAQRARLEHRVISVERSDPGVVEVDRLRVEQALANLIENALRHGGGDVSLSARRSVDTIEFSVRDAGRGIPQLFVDRAFERFTRADQARSEPGAGLGLAIVKLVAQAHGGEPYVLQDATHCEIGMRMPASSTDNAA